MGRLGQAARAGAAVLVACAATASLSGCALEPEPLPEIPPKPVTPLGSNKGEVGDSIRLAEADSALRVRVKRVLDPARSGPADTPLAEGARFVGIVLDLTNVGDSPFSESPISGVELLDSRGRKATPVTLVGGPCGGRFGSHVEIAPGRTRAGCIAFEVHPGGSPAVFRFRLGYTGEVGEWRLRAGAN